MAVGIHVARVAFKAVSTVTGQPIDKESPNTKIKDVMNSEHRHIILPDSSIPSASGYPTVDAYLKLEAAANYIVYHMDQNMIVTYNKADL